MRDLFTLNAVGLITTSMPDGSPGFSLLLVITAEFAQGIQLGFGFTLLGVGGSSASTGRSPAGAARRRPQRRGRSSDVPEGRLANAPRIISDLKTFFPPRAGTFLIGPMAKIGWGTPTLVRIALGIIVEIPGNIAAIGVVRVAIPNADAPLILLQVSFAGALEFDRKRFFFFAALFESRIGFQTLEGEMGLLLAFGTGANFVLTVGGFHPRFIAPPLPFPSPHRIKRRSSTRRPRVSMRTATWRSRRTPCSSARRLELFFGFKSFYVQGHLPFDALFRFSPFHFTVDIAASLSVKVFGAGLFSVKIRGTLDGPAPWHVEGHGSISLLFWSLDVDFSKTWGESLNDVLPPVAVFPLLVAELAKAENWRALLPPANRLLVSVRSRTATADLVLHPLGALQVSQRALPLALKSTSSEISGSST